MPDYINLAKAQNIFGDMLINVHKVAARPAVTRETCSPLLPSTQKALASMNISKLYFHQSVAIDKVRDGQNVIVSTGTASGKSLCYSVPIVERLSQNPRASALFLFPTKALSHDQIMNFNSFCAAGETDVVANTYDGDTPKANRRSIRDSSKSIMTNMDMMAASMLPQHRVWRNFLSGLEFVVIDEAHYYRGVMGSHLALLIRRLRRILNNYGATPTFILCSATLANAKEHAEAITGLPFSSIMKDGSPSGGKTFMMLNPSVLKDDNKGINARSGALLAGLMMSGIRSLAFVSNRAAAERVVQYTQQSIQDSAATASLRGSADGALYSLADKVKPYRAGYSPEYRRSTEAALRDGTLLGLVSTNAMELGVDIGGLSGVVLTGYPGSIASFWQQAGRAGRQQDESLALILLKDSAVDQFFAHNPDALYDAATESARVNVTNDHILEDHLLCAAVELPLTRKDFPIFGEETTMRVAAKLSRQGLLETHPDRSRRAARHVENPSYSINIRSIGSKGLVELVNINTEEVMERVEWSFSVREFYPGAIYVHQGRPFRVMSFNPDLLKAYAKRVDSYEYTTPVTETNVNEIEGSTPSIVNIPNSKAAVGDLDVSVHVIGYRTQHLYNRDYGADFTPVENMPAVAFETKGFWLGLGKNVELPYSTLMKPEGALHAFAHVAITALSTLTMCDPGDLSDTLIMEHEAFDAPAAFIYENHEGGVGIVDYASDHPDELLARMDSIVTNCRCRHGCPSCVEMARCSDGSEIEPSKSSLLALLRGLRKPDTTPDILANQTSGNRDHHPART